MAEGEEYYEEQLVEDEEKTETTILDRLLGKHFENLSARQYYVCFGVAGLVMFCYMFLLLIAVGHWTVSASPIVVAEQFSSLSVIPVAIVFAVMFFCAIGGWGCAFMGFGLNYFELPAGPTYVFWAFLSNVLCSVLFVFSIAYWALVPLSHDVINAAFTDYRWTYYVTRNDLKRLPDGGMCDVTGSTAELTAKKADCANRTYAYLKNWTIITSIIGMIVSCITVAAIMYPIPPKKSNKVVDGEDKEA